eukprot:3572124-Amphidinium_carterae.1
MLKAPTGMCVPVSLAEIKGVTSGQHLEWRMQEVPRYPSVGDHGKQWHVVHCREQFDVALTDLKKVPSCPFQQLRAMRPLGFGTPPAP